jgi:hypothetical protein
VALVIKYQFHDTLVPDGQQANKKRKVDEDKNSSVIDYSQLKLPAVMFVQYLETDSSGFIADCVR